MHGDCRDHNMKVVFKVGGSNPTPSPTFPSHHGGSWSSFVGSAATNHSSRLPPIHHPTAPPPLAVLPAYNHVEGRQKNGDNGDNEEMPFVALADNSVVVVGSRHGGTDLTDSHGRKRGVNSGGKIVAASARHESFEEWPLRGADSATSESLVKRLRERMAMEAALRNEATSTHSRGLAGLSGLVVLLIASC